MLRFVIGVLGLAVAVFASPASPGEVAARSAAYHLGVGTFLVARDDLPDPNFFETVVLLLAYDEEEGAAGLIVNRRSEIAVGDAVTGGSPFAGRRDALYLGGPVAAGTVLVLQRGAEAPAGAQRIVDDVYLVGDREALEGLLQSDPAAATVRFYAGYAGWSRGQLEDEISRGVWHVMPGDAARVFSDTPRDAWADLIRIVFGPRA